MVFHSAFVHALLAYSLPHQRWIERGKVPAQQVPRRHAQEAFGVLVPGDQAFLAVHHHNGDRGVLEDGAIAFFGDLQLAFGLLAFQSVADGAHQHVTVHLALDQVVLHALLDGFRGRIFVVQSRQDDDRNVRRLGLQLDHRVHAFAVGQPGVEKDDIEAGARHLIQGLRDAVDALDLRNRQRRARQEPLEHGPVHHVVFHDKQSKCLRCSQCPSPSYPDRQPESGKTPRPADRQTVCRLA